MGRKSPSEKNINLSGRRMTEYYEEGAVTVRSRASQSELHSNPIIEKLKSSRSMSHQSDDNSLAGKKRMSVPAGISSRNIANMHNT